MLLINCKYWFFYKQIEYTNEKNRCSYVKKINFVNKFNLNCYVMLTKVNLIIVNLTLVKLALG